ncbi:hypothetical protein JM654_16330 [Microbacterium oxydans]|nr:hypothetical protein [Microbacterium oxydans]
MTSRTIVRSTCAVLAVGAALAMSAPLTAAVPVAAAAEQSALNWVVNTRPEAPSADVLRSAIEGAGGGAVDHLSRDRGDGRPRTRRRLPHSARESRLGPVRWPDPNVDRSGHADRTRATDRRRHDGADDDAGRGHRVEHRRHRGRRHRRGREWW